MLLLSRCLPTDLLFRRPGAFVLPRKAADAPSMTLVLDLDETLVHCSVEPITNADLTFPVVFNGVEYRVCTQKTQL